MGRLALIALACAGLVRAQVAAEFAQRVRAAMEPGWDRVAQGMVETEAGPLLLIDVTALIAGPDLRAAA